MSATAWAGVSTVLFVALVITYIILCRVRRKYNANLINNPKVFQRAVEEGNLGLWHWDISTNKVYWSNNVETILGLPKGSFGGTFDAYNEMVHPDDVPWVQQKINEALNNQSPYHIEHRMVLPNGSIRWIKGRGKVHFSVNGKPISMSGNVADITLEKQFGNEKEALFEQLKQTNHELEQFTYSVSHDLRSPLITIKEFIQVIQADLAENNLEGIKTDLGYMRKVADKMEMQLQGLLTLSRITSGKLVSERVNLQAVINEVSQLLGGHIHAKNIALVVHQNFPTIHGSKIRLIQLFQNLIENAIKFMGQQASPLIEVGHRRLHGQTTYFVRDNGIGISQNQQEIVFNLFHKLNQADDGTGIGLALVKKIVEMHQGKIWVHSEGSNKGTTFLFTLPGLPAVQQYNTPTYPPAK